MAKEQGVSKKYRETCFPIPGTPEYLLDKGSQIIEHRMDGLSEYEAARKSMLSTYKINLWKKRCPSFKRQMEYAREAALLWWKDELGRAARYKRGDVQGIITYIKMEFDVDVVENEDKDESYNVTYVVRKKVE